MPSLWHHKVTIGIQVVKEKAGLKRKPMIETSVTKYGDGFSTLIHPFLPARMPYR